MSYLVKSIFGPTLQGEGPHAGWPCLFLRLAGCNAWDGRPETRAASACPYCDTDFRGGTRMDLAAIRAALRRQGAGHGRLGLVLSGGEPLLQADAPLLDGLAADHAWVDIETNGTRAVPPHPANVHISCSPKAISGETIRCQPDWWKILIPAQEAFLEQALASGAPVYLQPVCPDEGPQGPVYQATLERCLALCYRHGCRLSLQTHKYLDIP
ncbi:MAG: 7-carboxy-7-deazaguanine synthase QueE [Planctomycetota bacterium]